MRDAAAQRRKVVGESIADVMFGEWETGPGGCFLLFWIGKEKLVL